MKIHEAKVNKKIHAKYLPVQIIALDKELLPQIHEVNVVSKKLLKEKE